ncbi:LysR substrate-binding domain-containing protein [Paraburkholderia oxyphila]|uniref:LysR substrate-binding domain-containing protein n=1 Tax=Paraburkholderia oxyphila TaxID=614212 RepID=UPI0005B82E15|nr:LysR substrate-binding domain-containing protein [Paraburkholderia oxyphila]
MNLRQLRYFVIIVDAGSFSRAAQVAHIAQPALSQQIADLEALLGVTLLQRSVRGVRATAAGERLYVEARAILRRVDRLREIVCEQGGEIEGNVCIGMSSTLASVLGGPIVAACHTALPKVHLKLSSSTSNQLADCIREQTLDLAVLFADAPPRKCASIPLFRQRLFLVRRADGSRARTSVAFSKLAEVPLILPYSPNVTRTVLDRAFAKAGLEPHVVTETDSVTSMVAAVQAGVGGAVLPLGSTEQLSGGRALVSLPIEPPIWITANIVTSAEAPLTAAGESVRDFIAAFVGRQLREHSLAGCEPLDD